jgi:hypothetical protein
MRSPARPTPRARCSIPPSVARPEFGAGALLLILLLLAGGAACGHRALEPLGDMSLGHDAGGDDADRVVPDGGPDQTSGCPCDQLIRVCEAGCACDPDCTQPPLSGGYTDIPCNDSGQCPASQECLLNDTEHDSWCAGECTADLDCASDGCCLGADGGGAYCYPPRYCNVP